MTNEVLYKLPSQKVFVSSIETGENTFRHYENRLVELHQKSSKLHTIVDDPEDADLILVCNFRDENHYSAVLNSQFINKYADKSFAICDHDRPPVLLRGIYASARKFAFDSKRTLSGCYKFSPRQEFLPRLAYKEQKQYLFSFTGGCTHPIRKQLLNQKYKRTDILIKDTSGVYKHFIGEREKQTEQRSDYGESLKSSKFVLCPRGYGCNSIRLFECMQSGVCPVIITNSWKKPRNADWSFAVFVDFKEIDKLEEYLIQLEPEYKSRGEAALKQHELWFSDEVYFDYLIEQCVFLKDNAKLSESMVWKWRKLNYLFYRILRKSLRSEY